jgi:DNA-damage-inducible protein D
MSEQNEQNEQGQTPQTSPFDAIRQVDEQGAEYWSARELSETLGYALWQNFAKVITQAQIACETSGYAVSDHFIDVNKMISAGKGARRSIKDFQLTRYACYLVVQNADPSKDIVAKAQTYFAIKTRGMELIELELTELVQQLDDDPFAEVMRRIMFRQELTEAHKALFAQAKQAGVITSEQWAWFMNQGYRGLYAGKTNTDIQRHKGLRRNQDISVYMSAVETFANLLRALIARQRLKDRQTSTVAGAGRTHFGAGNDVRQILLAAGLTPENLPTPTKSYRQIVKEEAERIRQEEELENGLWGNSCHENNQNSAIVTRAIAVESPLKQAAHRSEPHHEQANE